ncbi:Ureidoglycolate hydrolase [Metarhizium album ARSEF 1941]|uniref:Ureidoglycolate hydrolase n=1 Tax=Metarhizium album (strain ARSEF 1941) TaxID=1081103 RepID=A0A0B2X2G0_METAS|nr:Ureidoglycolate hydrolase [Metarhizium album ARSEF 1941]KHN99430.1 Ureidoglycolate hydrolase [Metarhizium album ARSEF 1941]
MGATTMQVDAAIQVAAAALTEEAFQPYGDVISNPRPDVHPSAFSSRSASLPANAVSANQGFAIQYRNVSRVRNLYGQSPSGRADAVMSMFVCSARGLSPLSATHDKFTVRLLERHPFTTQTFAPVASSARRYLVVVAPSLPPSGADRHLPAPEADGLPGRGLPHLKALRAFVATDAQAVTYAPGTWHAPMVALGAPGTTLDFVVSQFASGVAVEDCQIVELEAGHRAEGGPSLVEVAVPKSRLEKL